ncbi:hypothetical protein [Amycolatopsis sp. MtRt-6]|uniref:hypothetical protein n=1 Tax=Amycolatopsis sp. MtRt-6 TaxID=2792782 RepID=UPI001A8CE768|nr:hypothetical protein [Amycolatopsis sp. MtRt-6]
MCEACELEADLPALPPVRLPAAAEARAAAERSPVLADLRRYVAELDGTSEPGDTLLPRWAEACGLVRVLKGTHVPVKKNAKLLEQPLELWARAFEALGEAGYGIAVEDDEVPFEFGMLFPDFLGGLQLTLYSAGHTPAPLELLYGIADEMSSMLVDLDIRGDSRWRHGLRVTLDVLDRLGAIERRDADEEELAEIAEAVGRPDPDPALVRLTPLAFWALNRMLRAKGVDAPVVGELATAPFETLADHLTEASPKIAEAELAAWIARRSPADAAAEAAEFLPAAESPAQRLMALLVLDATGDAGVAAARTVREEGGIAGAVTAAWLAERDESVAGSLTAGEMSLGMTDHLAAMDDHGVLFDELDALGDPLAVVGVIAAADHPDRLRLLDVIAQEHPDNKVAKQARKARFTLRRN